MSIDDSDTTVKTKVNTSQDIDAELADLRQQDFDPSEFYEYANSNLISESDFTQETNSTSSQDVKLDADNSSKDLLAATYIKNITASMMAEKEKSVDPAALINSLEVQSKLNEGKKATSLLEAKAAESAKYEQEKAERTKAEQEQEAERIKAEQEQEAERIKAEQEAERIKASVASQNQQPNSHPQDEAQQQAINEAARIKAAAQQSNESQSPEDLLKAYVASQSPNKQPAPVDNVTPLPTPVELATTATVMQPMQIKAAANDTAGLYSGSQPARAKVIPLFPNAQQNRPEEAPVRSPELAVSDKFIHDLATKRLARTKDKRLEVLMARGEKLALKEAGKTEKRDLNNQQREKAERALSRAEIASNGGHVAPIQPNTTTSPGTQANTQGNKQSAPTDTSSENNTNETNSTDNDDPSNDSGEKKGNDSMFGVKHNPHTGSMSAKADLNQAGAMLAGMTHGVVTGVFSSMSGIGYSIYRTMKHAGIEKRVEKDIKHVKDLEILKNKRDEHAKAVRDHIMAMEKEEAKAESELAKKEKGKKVDLVKHGKEDDKNKPSDDYQVSIDKKEIDLLDCNKLTKTHLNNVYSEYDKFIKNNKALDDKKNPMSDAVRVKAKDATRNAFDKYIRNAEGLNNNIAQNLKKGDDGDIAAAGLLSKMNNDMQTNMAKSKKSGNLRSQKNDEQAMSQVMKKTSALLTSLGKALKNALGSMGKKKSPKA